MVLTDDAEVRELNRAYRHEDRTTDVLSFALDDPHAAPLLGDVVVSVEQAARQAGAGELEAEILRLLAHGLCHLLGLDHQRPAAAAEMRAAEARLLTPLGLEPFLSPS